MVYISWYTHCNATNADSIRIGLLKVATSYFLISISDREQVAQIRGKPIYKITDVALIPLSSQAEADKAIATTRDHVKRHSRAPGLAEDDTDSESEDAAPSVTDSLLEEETPVQTEVKDPVTGQKGIAPQKTTVAKDVIQSKGVYGRFADKWFSSKGWSNDNRRLQGIRSDEDLKVKNVFQNVDSVVSGEDAQPSSAAQPEAIPSDDKNLPDVVNPETIPKALSGDKDATTVALLPKILQTTRMYFSSGNFFFSYDYDISHGVGQQQPNSSLPLFKQFDPLVCHARPLLQLEANRSSVLLEPQYRLTVHRRRPAFFRAPYYSRICWSKSFHHQTCRHSVEQLGR